MTTALLIATILILLVLIWVSNRAARRGGIRDGYAATFLHDVRKLVRDEGLTQAPAVPLDKVMLRYTKETTWGVTPGKADGVYRPKALNRAPRPAPSAWHAADGMRPRGSDGASIDPMFMPQVFDHLGNPQMAPAIMPPADSAWQPECCPPPASYTVESNGRTFTVPAQALAQTAPPTTHPAPDPTPVEADYGTDSDPGSSSSDCSGGDGGAASGD